MPEAVAKTVLIVGASGVIGAAAVEHFARLGGWRVLGLSRRRPDVAAEATFDHLAVDLNDPAACRAAAEGFGAVTHVVYAALFEKPGLVAGWYEEDQMRTNLAMMRNLMDPLLARATGLRHVSVLQGTKAYGAHVHRLAVPARERPAARSARQLLLAAGGLHPPGASAGAAGASPSGARRWCSAAPLGVAMNLIPIIGAYGAICRELGRPFACPGEHGHVIEAVDTDLIAKALAWAAEAPAARNETFNITNGDVFVWENVWPAIARALGLEPAFGAAGRLSPNSCPRTPRSGTGSSRSTTFAAFPWPTCVGQSHHYADLLFAVELRGPAHRRCWSAPSRSARPASATAMDTEAMFAKWLNKLVDRGVLPPP